MSTIITHSAGSIAPDVVDGFTASRVTRSLVHVIPGRPDPDVTYRPASLRKGKLTLIFATGAAAVAAEAILVTAQVFTLSDTDVPEVAMPFVVADESESEIVVQLDPATRKAWSVTLPFQEVAL